MNLETLQRHLSMVVVSVSQTQLYSDIYGYENKRYPETNIAQLTHFIVRPINTIPFNSFAAVNAPFKVSILTNPYISVLPLASLLFILASTTGPHELKSSTK